MARINLFHTELFHCHPKTSKNQSLEEFQPYICEKKTEDQVDTRRAAKTEEIQNND